MKTINATLGALVRAEATLANLGTLKLSAKHAYHLTKLTRLVGAETTHFHSQREALIKELGTQREASYDWEIAHGTPAMATFLERIAEVEAIEVEITWRPLTLDTLGDEKVSAADLAALGSLLAEYVEAP